MTNAGNFPSPELQKFLRRLKEQQERISAVHSSALHALAPILEQNRRIQEIAQAAMPAAAFREFQVRQLGRSGEITELMKRMAQIDSSVKPLFGKEANELKQIASSWVTSEIEREEAAALALRLEAGRIDVTLPGRRAPQGSQHLIAQITEEIIDIFAGIGYRVAEGPEVELDFYNFTALNHAPEHPARSASDTFYVVDHSEEAATWDGPEPSEVLMRTHTSPVQVRTMVNQEPPIYILAPGKVYRRDIADPSHLPQFTQVEGLVIDEGITFADLKGTLDHFVREMFGPDRKTRFRPHFFPFTEPSAEVDVSCNICGGEGCRFCKGTGWLEILGCGMVDPNVFAHAGVDGTRYSGFAFGMGVERIAALRYDLPDLRMLVEGDMRFLRQF